MIKVSSTRADGPMGSGQHPTPENLSSRKSFIARHGSFLDPVMVRAEHGKVVHVVNEQATGKLLVGDGLITREPKLPLVVTHSDCLPIFLWDENETMCGIVHAGWRGVVANIAGEAIRIVQEQGVKLSDIRAHIGPHIGPCCFSIKEDVASLLGPLKRDAVIERDGTMYGALADVVIDQMQRVGLTSDQIAVDWRCTVCTKGEDGDWLFASYRRDGELARNMMSFLSLE